MSIFSYINVDQELIKKTEHLQHVGSKFTLEHIVERQFIQKGKLFKISSTKRRTELPF